MDDFYVYVYVDQTKPGRYTYGGVTFLFEPFYVGKGHGRRKLTHRWDVTIDHRTRRVRAIKAATGQWPDVIALHDGLEESRAFELEMATILEIGRRGCGSGPLTNLNDGGHGGRRGAAMSQKSKDKISAANRGRVRATGWHHSEDAKQKMRGKKSPEAIANMTAARRARKEQTEEEKAIWRAKISASLLGNVPWNKGLSQAIGIKT